MLRDLEIKNAIPKKTEVTMMKYVSKKKNFAETLFLITEFFTNSGFQNLNFKK